MAVVIGLTFLWLQGLQPWLAKKYGWKMGPDQATDAILRVQGGIEIREHRGLIALQHFQKQGTRQLLLRSEEMEEAAVRSPRPGANGRDGGAFKAVPIEHRQSRGQ